ncbi:Uma2 family endonuclease [Actinomadura atramentaria]|uniref:Uma2 family endonuclease n=1 Tax=Actinomadura atramentaria TaxID=1990 RepID=UPI0003A778CC|nr:Uma2 family endonuclease [Actinomadura atramentaria]
MGAESLTHWLTPPPGGFTVDDFLSMRDLPRHTELIDGSLVFVSPQQIWHVRIIDLIREELKRQAPPEWRVEREMSVRLAKHEMPEPDLIVVTAEAYANQARTSTYYTADDLVLAVEAVSPESVSRDRLVKPLKYAAAGIEHFWRVEQDGDRTVVYVYVRDPATAEYALTGIFHEHMKLTVPFEIDLDLTRVMG